MIKEKMQLSNRQDVAVICVVDPERYRNIAWKAAVDMAKALGSPELRAKLTDHHLISSMSHKDNCYDNAMVESFFHTLKVELTHRKSYFTRKQAMTEIENYIEGFYNPIRRHASIDYLSPN